MPDKIKVLYDAVSKDYNVGSYDEFSSKLADPNKRKAFYDGVGSEYALGEYKEFESKISSEPQPAAKNILTAAQDLSNQRVSVQPEDLRIKQEKEAAVKAESLGKRLKDANKVFEVSQGKGVVDKVRKSADLQKRTTVTTLEPVNESSYLNIPGRVGAEVLKAASKLSSTVASIGREAIYMKNTGLVGAPALYDENGEKTEYAKQVGFEDDFLGKMVLGANGLSEDANVVLKNTTLPNSFMGRGLTSVATMAPDLIAAAATGGSSTLLEKGATELGADVAAKSFAGFAKKIALNPFAKVLAAKGFTEGYTATEKQGGNVEGRLIEGGKEGGTGFKEGMMMELYGFGAGELGKSASKFLKETGVVNSPGAWTNAMTGTAANMLVFGGQPLLAGDKTGAESGLFIGALFGVIHGKSSIREQNRLDKQIKSINPELSIKDAPNIILDITHANRINNFNKATPEAIKNAFESKMGADDMNAQALDFGKRALEEGDPAVKKQLLVASDTFRKASDIKRSVENIVEFKQDWHDFIDASDRVTPEQKAAFKQKVDDVAYEYSPIEKHKKAIADVIEPLDERQKELKDAVAAESDPVRKAEKQAELDANNEQLKAHQAELADVTERQVTGDVASDSKGKVVKLKTKEETLKESEDTDKKILKFQETTGLKIDPIDNIPPSVDRTFNRIENDVPTDPVALKEASDWIYAKYKELSAMKKSDSRLLTIEQIESMQEQLGKDIGLLENHRNKYNDGEPTTKLQEQTTSRTDGEASTNQETTKAGEGTESQKTQEGSIRSVEEVVKDMKGLTATYHDVLKERGLYDQAEKGKAPKGAVAAAKMEAEKRYGKMAFDLKAEREAAEKTAAIPETPTEVVAQTELVAEPIKKQKKAKAQKEIVKEPTVTIVPDPIIVDPEKTKQETKTDPTQEVKKEEPAGPVDETPAEIESPQGDKIQINHAEIESVRSELDLENIEKEGTTTEAIVASAVKSIKAGYNVPNLIKKLKGIHLPSAKEQAIVGLYIEALVKENNKNPSSELLNSIDEASEALFGARSRIGLALGVTSNLIRPRQDLSNHMILEQKAMGVKKLKQTDVDRLKDEFDKAEAARKRAEEAYERAEVQSNDPAFREAVIKTAAGVLEKMKGDVKVSRKDPAQKKDFATERAKIKADLVLAFKKSLGKTYASVPLAPQLVAIAPHVLKLVRSYVEQGIVKLEDVVTRLDADLDLKAIGISQDDIHDIIVGKYNQTQRKRSDAAKIMADIKTEAKLLKELDKLQSAPEPKAPVANQRRSERIEELKEKVQEARKKNKEDFPEEYDKQSIARRTKMLKDRATQLEADLKNGGFAAEKTPPRKVKLDAEGQKAEDEYIAFLRESNRRRDKYKFENQSSYEKYMHYGEQVLGLRRLAQTSFDWSMPFRQVIVPTLNPRHWGIGSDVLTSGGLSRLPGNIANSTNAQAWSAMIKNTVSQVRYDRMMYRMETSEAYPRMIADKITFNSLDALENKYRNEDFRTSFIYKIPSAVEKLPIGLRIASMPVVALVKVLEASQRAADSYVNVARYELYLRGENNLIKSGVDRTESPEAYKEMAKWAMNMTGRGNLLASWEAPQMQTILGNTFYGTRLMASRFNMLNPRYYMKMPKAVRMEAVRDILGYLGTFSALALAAQQSGFTVSLNPDEADFLKFKRGDARFDMTGGVGQYIRTGFRVMHAFYNVPAVAAGVVSKTHAQKYGAFAFKSFASFFDYKLAPNASYALNALRGKDALGNEFKPTDFFKVYPMYFDDISKGMKSGDVSGTIAIVGASMIGIGAQTYSNKDERKTPDMKLATITDRGAEYDMEQNGLTEERKKFYNEFYKANKDRIIKYHKARAKTQKVKVQAGIKEGLNEEQLKARFPDYFMTDKDIDNKVSDKAVAYSKKKILERHKKLKIAD